MAVMPNRVRVVVLVSALALAAGLLMLTLLAKPAQTQAETFTINEQVPIRFSTDNCTGEPVAFEGTQHLLLHVTQNATGGFLVINHSDLQGQGVSPSGAK
jgi:hypothetical protein